MKSKIEKFLRYLYSPPAIVFMVAFIVNLFIAWFNFSTYRIWNFDLAWQTQVVQSYAELREPTVSMIGDNYKALGNHFSPILALAAPFYALFPSSFTLNVVGSLCFALSAAILTHTALKYLSKPASLFLGLGLAVSWGFITASGAQFHEYALGAPFLAYGLAKFIEGNYKSAAIATGFLVFVKEDVGLLLIGLGIVMAIRGKAWRWLLLSAWGGLWVIFSIKFFIPAISGVWEFDGFVTVDGKTLFTDITFKVLLVGFLILQGGLIALRSPLAYIVIPLLGARLFTAWSGFYILGYHYDVLTVIVASFALLDALIRYPWDEKLKKFALALPIITTIVFLTIPTPGNTMSWLTRDYSQDEAAVAAYEGVYEAIPADAIVASEDIVVGGFLDRGYNTYFIRAVENREHAPECLVNAQEEILGPTGEPISSISEYGEKFDRHYELVYDTDYIKAWCSHD